MLVSMHSFDLIWVAFILCIIQNHYAIVAAQSIESVNGSIVWSIPGATMKFSSDAAGAVLLLPGGRMTTFASQSALDTAIGATQSQFSSTSTRINGIDAVNTGLQSQVFRLFIFCKFL